MRETVGMVLFVAGLAGLLVGRHGSPLGSLGWAYWNRRQRIICSVSLGVAFTGLILIG
jgi:hypothetical protein